MTPNNDETRKSEETSASPEAAPEAADSTPDDTSESSAKSPETSESAASSDVDESPAEAQPAESAEPVAKARPAKSTEPAAEATSAESEASTTAASPESEAESAAESAPAEKTEPREEAPTAEMAALPESQETPAASSAGGEADSEESGSAETEAAEGAESPATEDEGEKQAETTDPEVAEELAKAAATVVPSLRPGKRLKVTLVQVGDKDSFVDFGGRSEGSIATSELKNEKDELKYNVGDEIGVVVRKGGDSPVFTLGKRRVPANLGKVKDAFENKVPVEGKIKSTNKGGFEVDLRGVRAFCPYSQIQLGYCDKPEEYVGQKLPFLVITFERGGRNIVVSRRKILEEESKMAAGETREKLELGAVFDGVVRRLQPYGAFIDIGGLDGLVHVSEIAHGRVTNPSDLLKVGDEVKVKVIKLEGEGEKQRISLSMKELAGDPWAEVPEKYVEGSTVPGKVVRLAEFGAFIELETGVDGLVHISEIATERIQHPSDKLQKGQEVEVRILQVDLEQRRISLSLLSEEEAEQARANRPPRRPGGAGAGRGRRDDGPMHHRSESPEEDREPKQDVTKMPFEDALQALKNKFKGD